MNIPRFTVHRPVFTSMIMLIMVILGGFTLMRLNIDLMPDLSLPTLTVITTYENASPEEMEELITKPLEEVLATITGVETLQSTSREGQSVIRVSFTWGTNLDASANDIRDGVDRISDRLPEEADNPRLLKFDTNDFPIIILGVGSHLDPIALRQLINDQIKYRIERLEGVAAINIWGGLEREIQVLIDHERLRALRISIDQVRQALQSANVTLPAGNIERGRTDIRIRVPGRYDNLDEIRDTVVTVRAGAPIYLHQIAEVVDTHARIERKALVNGEPGVQLLIRKQAGYNTVEVANRAMAELDRLRGDFPQLSIAPVINTGEYIQRAIDNLSTSLYFGAGMSFLVLLFFLRNLRSALLVGTAIPISVIAAFTLIYFSGFTINMMTLGGLALGVGMMVDNAIVVLEAITRAREEEGLDPVEASIQGTQQVVGGITGGTLTTVVVFLPLIFAEGMAGQMFSEMGYVITFSLFASLAVAVALAPMLASRLLRREERRGKVIENPRLQKLADRVGEIIRAAEDRYQKILRGSLARPGSVLATVLLVLFGSLLIVPFVGTEFMPPSDESQVRVQFEMKPGTRLEIVEEKMKEVLEVVQARVPELKNSVATIGPTLIRPEARSLGEMTVGLIPVVERERSSEEIANDLRQHLGHITGGILRAQAPEDVMLQMIGGGDPIQLEIRGYDLQTLSRLAEEISEAIYELESITDVRVSLKEGVPQVLLNIDRRKAADLGLSVAQIARTLETAIAGSTASRFRDQGEEFGILLKFQGAKNMEVDDILDITLLNPAGQQIMLRNVVTPETGIGPVEIERKDQQRLITIGANFKDVDLGTAVQSIRDTIAAIPMPAGYQTIFAGEYEELQKAFQDLGLVMILAIILVYMVMASLYESLIDPFVVMFAVPLAIIGVNLVLLLTGTSFNIVSLIGAVILIGVVVNNAILLVERTNQLRQNEGYAVVDALIEAGRQRLRPILMTALTTILAMLPLAFAQGEGANIQQSMSRSVIGGLVSSTFITLVVVPIMYMLFHRKDQQAEAAES